MGIYQRRSCNGVKGARTGKMQEKGRCFPSKGGGGGGEGGKREDSRMGRAESNSYRRRRRDMAGEKGGMMRGGEGGKREDVETGGHAS